MIFKQIPSPNYSKRESKIIDMVVIHNISLPPKQFGEQFDNTYIEDFFCNRLDSSKDEYFQEIKDLKVSAHLLIKRSGEVVQFVDFANKAWHAGVSHYKGRENCNDFSIGIELEGSDDIKYTDNQYTALNEILDFLKNKYPIKYIVGHNEIAPKRKTDPGKAFEWQRITNHNEYK